MISSDAYDTSSDEVAPRPVVSVVIPAYNASHHIPKAIDALLKQTFEGWEAIVVDDCSCDDPAAALLPYAADPRIRLIRRSENGGASAARNTGIQLARGRFIAFLDADDTWLPRKLEMQVDAVLAQPEPDRVFCVTRTIVSLTANRHLIRPLRGKVAHERMDEFIFVSAGFCQTSSFFVSKKLARQITWRSLPIGEDHMFAIDACATGAEYLLVDEPLTIYHDEIRPGRLSHTAGLAKGRIFMEAVDGVLSAKAMLAYQSRQLGVSIMRNNPLCGIQLIGRAVAAGALSPRFALSLLVRAVTPTRLYHELRSRLLGTSSSEASKTRAH
jgi:glycosyltransferase involved in cell wall biosynthesis